MIQYTNRDDLEILFAKIFDYGFKHDYHPKAIEQRIVDSFFVDKLENNDDSFLDKYTIDQLLKMTFSLKDDDDIEMGYSTLSLWIAMTYIDLFFEFRKSFSYLFLYFPLEDAVYRFDVYHEMDVTQILKYFVDRTNESTLFSKILKEKKITTKQMSILTDISIDTLNGYSKSDNIFYGANFEYMMLISQILNVKPNLFLKNVYISMPVSGYLTEKEKAQYLKDSYGYFNTKEIREKYSYDPKNNELIGKSQNIKFYDHYSDYSYEKLMEAINFYVEMGNNKALVVDHTLYDSIDDKSKLVLIDNNTYVDGLNNKSYEIPIIVKEYALIKAKETPYSFVKL